MNKQPNLDARLFKNLKALSESSFPKKCSSCGKVYESSEQFVFNTAEVAGRSGLKSSLDDGGGQIVELFRNCICGSTLMECFNDRRSLSKSGLKRRALFGRLMVMLEKEGVPGDQARTELLKLIQGERSHLLEQIGITFKSH